MNVIEVNNLSKEYKYKVKDNNKGFLYNLFNEKEKIVKAVNDISFNVEEGETVAFIGPNGAGKSTTIKMLTGILYPTKGDIKICGLTPIKDRNLLSYKIGTVFGQRSQLLPNLPLTESMGMFGVMYDMDKDTIKKRINELSKLFDLKEFIKQPVRKLSLGQRMRAEIATSLMHSPKIIFLDEPTIGLDIFAKARIRQIIKKMNEEKGTTIFLTSHDLGDVEALCDRIIIINNGTIVTDSTLEDLKANYLSEKVIKISYDKYVTQSQFEYPVEKVEHNQIELKADTNKVQMGELLSYFTSIGNITDIQIESTPLEEVIKKLYKERR